MSKPWHIGIGRDTLENLQKKKDHYEQHIKVLEVNLRPALRKIIDVIDSEIIKTKCQQAYSQGQES